MASDETRITLTRTAGASVRGAEVVIPRALGGVQLGRELGRGGMGVVYLGRDRMLGRDVAVKFLLNAVTGPDDPGFTRFLEGARAAADVRHAGLNTIFAADVVEGIPYLVLEYIDGPTLSVVIRHEGGLSVSMCAAILDAAASGLGALHEQGIVHGDVKPENLLLSFEGQAVVTDFGLAHARGTSHGKRVGGTPAYMSPEMFDGVVSERSDVYALGITMFEMLAGQLPATHGGFRAAGTSARAEARGSRDAIDPLPSAPLDERGISPAIREVLERATHKNPMFRYKTAEHFVRAVRDAVGGETVATVGDLAALATRCVGESSVGDETPSPAPGSSSYVEQIATLAASKRGERRLSAPPEGLEEQPVRRPQLGMLIIDISCVQCDYNLRSLPADTHCPECGQPVQESLKPDRLLFADEWWFGRVLRGVTITNMAATVAIPLVVVGLFVLAGAPFMPVALLDGVGPIALDVLSLLLRYGVFALLTAAGVGMYLATAPEPGGLPTRSARIIPVVVRVFLLLAAGAMVLTMVPLGRAGTYGLLGEIAAYLLFVGYIATLVKRIPDRKLASTTRNWLVLIGLLLVTLSFVAPMWVVPWLRYALPRGDLWWMLSLPTLALLTLLASVATPLLLARYRRALRAVSKNLTSYAALFEERESNPTGNETTALETPCEQDVDHILRLERCPRCDYCLERLPRNYRCPECGFAYDESMFMVYGWATKDHVPNFRRMLFGSSSMVLQLLVAAAFAYILYIAARDGTWNVLVFMAVVVLIVYVQYDYRVSKQRAHGGVLQMAFSSQGASIRVGPGEPRFIPWQRFRRLKLRRVGNGRWRILLSAQRINLFLPSRGGSHSLLGKPIVTAVIECDDVQAHHLEREIQRRLVAAKSQTPHDHS